jgi:hypothetical protein
VCSRLWSKKDHPVLTDAELTKDLVTAPGPTFLVVEQSFKRGWTLIANGDMRFTDPTNDKVTNPKMRRWLVERIGASIPPPYFFRARSLRTALW